jgi:predicted metal-dependent hydrolase
MPGKDFTLDNGLTVTIYKRKTSRHLRLSLSSAGKIRVSIPAWVSYKAGLDFARSRQEWISEQHQPANLLKQGQLVGKSHHLLFVAASVMQSTSRIKDSTIQIRYPTELDINDAAIQKVATEACVRALRSQAEQLLPQRLAQLARQHNFTYRSVTIKRLKGRWGSCDQHHNIVLNLFLMQLPWELIDYVVLHELTHTRILRHGPDFWQVMVQVSPQAKDLRKKIRQHQPVVSSNS